MSTSRPRRGDHVTLHEVQDEEGTRYVLEGSEGSFAELPLGERDAFVWARLDGETSLDELGAAYLEAFDVVHPDLPGLIADLERLGLLAHPAPPPALDSGSRLWSTVAGLAQMKMWAPRARPFWSAVGRVTAPLFAAPVGIAALGVALAGLVVALAGVSPAPSLPLLRAPGGSLLLGVLLLLGLNLAVDLLEAIAQVGVLGRSERAPGRIGLSVDLGIPGIYVDTPDAILLPRGRRVRLLLAPLLSAAFVAGGATLLAWKLAAGPTALALLHKLAWVASLRVVVHLNPVGPGPVYDALRFGLEVPGLRRLARRFLRLGPWTDGEEGYSPRELFLLGYCVAVVAYAVLAASVGAELLGAQVLPVWHAAQAAGDLGSLLFLSALAVLLGVPTLLAIAAGLLILLQAGLQALGRTEWFADPRSLGGVLAAVALVVAGSPWFLEQLGVLGVEAALLDLGWAASALLALVGVGLGWSLSQRAGTGWGSLDGTLIACASAALGLTWVATAVGVGQALGGLVVGMTALVSAGCLYAWGAIEVARLLPESQAPALGIDDLFSLRALVVASGPLLAVGLLVFDLAVLGPKGGAPLPGLLLPAIGLTTAAGILLGVAAWSGRQGARAAGLLLGLAAQLTLLIAWHAWGLNRKTALPGPLVASGLHLPLLSSALLAAAALLLRQSFERVLAGPRRLPPIESALVGTSESPREVSAAAWVLDALAFGVIDLYGAGVNRAVAAPLEAEGLSLKGDAPGERSHRHREAIVRYAHGIGERAGDQVARELVEGVLARLPAVAHERLEAHAHALIPGLGAIREAGADVRRRLLGQVVQLSDFDEAALARLADWLGVQVVAAGQVLIRQGEHGERFYLVVRGRLEVFVEGPGGDERRVATLGPGDAFGEAALLSHATRSATVIAAAESLLLTLDRPVFAELLRARPELLPQVFARQEDLQLVREVPLFAELPGAQVAALCRRFEVERAEPGAAIVTQGEPGERFYLIREGQVAVRRADEDGEPRELATLGRGEYFGELALLHDQPRSASVVALEPTELLTLDREAFRTHLAGRELLERSSSQRLAALGEGGEA